MRQPRRRWRSIFFATVLVLCAVPLVASGAQAQKIFTVVIPVIPSTLDYAAYQGQPSADVGSMYSANLVRYKAPRPGTTQVQGPFAVEGSLAQSFKRNPDDSYTFTLRKAKSPYGNTVTSADVKWSFERMVANDAIARFFFGTSNVDQTNPITVINASQFTLNRTKPSGLGIAFATFFLVSILDSVEVKKHATESDPWAKEWLSTHTATFGAYTVDSFTPGQEVRFVKNPNFWKKLDIDQIVMRAVPDAGTRTQLIASGQVDYTTYLQWDQFRALARNKSVKVIPELAANTDYLVLNKKFKAFDDPRVRKAIAMAIDRRALIRSVYAGFGIVQDNVMPYAVPRPKVITAALPYNPNAARALLAQAGYADLSFTLYGTPARPGAYVQQLAELIQSQLQAIGVKTNIQLVASGSQFEADKRAGKYDAWFNDSRPAIIDPAYDAALKHRTFPLGTQNFDGYSNPRLDKLVNLALDTPPGRRRNRYLATIEEILNADVPWVPLVEKVNGHVFRANISGYIPSPTSLIYPETLTKK